MKLQLVFTFLIFMFFSSLLPAAHAQQNKDANSVSERKFNRLMKNENAIVIDVRTTEEFVSGHIPGAIHMDVQKDNFKQLIKTLDPSKIYLVYCKSGRRSAKAASILKENEFKNVRHLQGGIEAWTGKINKE